MIKLWDCEWGMRHTSTALYFYRASKMYRYVHKPTANF